ncbi:MAG: substrate-binding domain-containing protein [Pseudomonadota bacterium]
MLKVTAVMAGVAAVLSASAGLAQAPSGGAARTEMLLVGSSTMLPFTEAIVDRLVRGQGLLPPLTQPRGSKAGINAFCAGVGLKHPDIVAASRRMARNEVESCKENGVVDILELKIGYGALVIATEKGDPVYNLTPRLMYLALAAEVPKGGDFVPNPYNRWADIDPKLPDLDIAIFGPSGDSGTRGFFDAAVMEGGCRGLKEIKSIFSADTRVRQCTTLRPAPNFEEAEEPFTTQVLERVLNSPKGTLALVSHATFTRNKNRLDELPINGVTATHATIAAGKYELVQRMYYYVKLAHTLRERGEKGEKGAKLVQGLRDFIAEATDDRAIGPGGYLEALDLVVMADKERTKVQDDARRLRGNVGH